jgi:hypothetical protein
MATLHPKEPPQTEPSTSITNRAMYHKQPCIASTYLHYFETIEMQYTYLASIREMSHTMALAFSCKRLRRVPSSSNTNRSGLLELFESPTDVRHLNEVIWNGLSSYSQASKYINTSSMHSSSTYSYRQHRHTGRRCGHENKALCTHPHRRTSLQSHWVSWHLRAAVGASSTPPQARPSSIAVDVEIALERWSRAAATNVSISRKLVKTSKTCDSM